jgi:hypothetical protein
MRASRIFSVAVAITALGACNDDTARRSCEMVVDTYCGRFTACNPEGTRDGCVSMIAGSMGQTSCASAVAVRSGAEAEQCRDAVEELRCEELRALPAVCKGAFLH